MMPFPYLSSRGEKMKKVHFGVMLLALALVFPIPTTAGVDVGVNISLPPLIVFSAPPEVVVIPETYVYAVPDVDVDIFFYDGWWWRPWEGRWYRSPPQHREAPKQSKPRQGKPERGEGEGQDRKQERKQDRK